MSTIEFVALYLLNSVFWKWIISWGGAQWIEGWKSMVVLDWFAWPWYRRWPWRWGMNYGVGMRCTLGKFQPVSQAQVDDIEAVIRSR